MFPPGEIHPRGRVPEGRALRDRLLRGRALRDGFLRGRNNLQNILMFQKIIILKN